MTRPVRPEYLCLSVAALALVLLLPASVWGSGLLVLGVLGLIGVMNSRVSPAGWFCWPNLFVLALTAFHLGYLLPAQYGLVPTNALQPAVDSPVVLDSLKLFVAACLALEVGVLASLVIRSGGAAVRLPRDEPRVTSTYYRLGQGVTFVSALLFVLYVAQLGVGAFQSQGYADFTALNTSNDPRFSAVSILYLPVGLLLQYAFMDRSRPHRALTWKILVPFFLFTIWLLWLGNRGTALLDWAALAYVHHLVVQRLSWRKALGVLGLILVVIAPVRQLRVLDPSQRASAVGSVSVSPLSALAEMGSSLRVFVFMVDSRDQGISLGPWPYVNALAHVVPNVGSARARVNAGDFRTTVWATNQLSPGAFAAGIGLGGSAIGEPYLAFGLMGVLVLFAILGWVIARLELWIVRGSAPALAFTAMTFLSIDWFVRDDAYGLVRPLVWAGVGTLVAAAMLLRSERVTSPLKRVVT